MAFILNLPYTLWGMVLALFLVPYKVKFHKKPIAFIFYVRANFYGFGYIQGWRGVTVGNTIILNPKEELGDLEHELVHVEQYDRLPLIQPLLYYYELFRRGYRENKYEKEAYQKAGNVYYEGKKF